MQPSSQSQSALLDILGYVNFSAGTSDPQFLRNLNTLFFEIAADPSASKLSVLRTWLDETLGKMREAGGAFADAEQARCVLTVVFDALLPAYRAFHRDLLFHQSDASLEHPFLLGRMFEAVLAAGPPWDATTRLVDDAIARLCDFIGYRPVPVLETEQKIEPYAHEWVRPVPLYVAGAGVAVGRYEPLITRTLEILRHTDPALLASAWFDPAALSELALDPRAYDFEHPANKRPNYHFGTWDPHWIDNKGRYRRFVLQQVTLDALLQRVDEAEPAAEAQRLEEAATVLAGTILMASGTSGSGPDSHDSSTTLATLLPHIAAYRDAFYQQRLASLDGALGDRLRAEAKQLHQPFGGARQYLNQELARRRASQLQHVHLAQLFARMGYPEAAMRQAETVNVASARMLCQMYCRLTLAHRAIDERRLAEVAGCLTEIEDLLQRAIECGALVDPWNIVGFGGNLSIFPAIENSIHDFRVDTLVELIEQIFAAAARAWSEAAARDEEALEADFSAFFDRLAAWWDHFATSTVESVRRVVGKEQQVSTNLVAGALSAWHKAGAAAGDVGFWRLFVDQLDSPKAFQLVVEALLEKRDLVASMALLMQWLSQSPRVDLEDGDSSFHRLAIRWISALAADECGPSTTESKWPLLKKFFDYLEANAETHWSVPQFRLAADIGGGPRAAERDESSPADDEEDQEQLFSAAYDEMTYRDTTDDGVDGATLPGERGTTDVELEHESQRLGGRLSFLATLGRLWKFAASRWGAGGSADSARHEAFCTWHAQAAANSAALGELLCAVDRHRLPTPSGDHQSHIEYDRHRMIKEDLLEQIVATAVVTADAARFLQAAGGAEAADVDVELSRGMLAGDAAQCRAHWSAYLEALRQRPILYVPLSKGGDPRQILAARVTQKALRDLLAWLPRLGMLQETAELLNAVQAMEISRAVGPGAVTEFDRLFENGYKGIVESIVVSSRQWVPPAEAGANDWHDADTQLVEYLQHFTESQLGHWLRHSRTLRLSVVEKLAADKPWKTLVQFVQDYGHDLFTQQFLNLGNLRAILHQGVDSWLARLEENPPADEEPKLLVDLDRAIPRTEAVRQLTLVLETIVENYGEYRDYNSTTTQSDQGEQLYTLIDFLRLRSQYDRVAWNLRPVVLAHEIVVRYGRSEAAEIWRRALREKTSDVADRHLAQLAALGRNYGMRLPTIADRLSERFVRPLAIDRVRALVQPAIEAAGKPDELESFAVLEQEIAELAKDPTGVGFDIPAWLVALEEEVSDVRSRERRAIEANEVYHHVPWTPLTAQDVQRQLDAIAGNA